MGHLQVIQSKIYEIRGVKVMLDFDLAKLYATETGQLKRAVRRNIERFPEDFMSQLTKDEFKYLMNNMVCQSGISKQGGIQYAPFAFTEQGVAMLSSVLRSDIAIKVNINIMRAFVSIRQYIFSNNTQNQEIDELKRHIQELENQGDKALTMIDQIGNETLEAINDLSEDTRKELDDIYLALSQLANSQKKSNKGLERKPIGFTHYSNKDKQDNQ